MGYRFSGGPLEDGRESEVHSLVVHMQGDGRFSVGYYRQVYVDGVPTGAFEWHDDAE